MQTSVISNDTQSLFWKRARLAYGATLFIFFCAIAFYFGPNYMLFGKLTWITPDDFAETAQTKVAPIVRATKQYAADHGELPSTDKLLSEQLVPTYLPAPSSGNISLTILRENGTIEYWTRWNHTIEYDLTPGHEGWSVRGVFASGPIALPLVSLDAKDRPATRPTTQSH